ncbi:acetyltransferase [Periconia macrospinosa]|uniref:Acetyltransferase n=1 Tax=Periconia macrospinosa TaxID=97972 RepID=A0A2V1DER2_9PLEO|nr:acetyltransferase [Periconia macrospinosa]
METRQWHKTLNGKTYTISTAPNLLPLSFIQEAFNKPAMYWANPLPTSTLQTMLDNSCTFGLYVSPTITTTTTTEANDKDKTMLPIGMARLVTDYVTLAYLTDVYVLDEYQGLGLGKWMVRCCRELVADMPALRFMVLLTGSAQAQSLYKRELGMRPMVSEEVGLTAMGARKEWLLEALVHMEID